MNMLVWVLVAGITGWLTGKLIGEEGYGSGLSGGCTRSLDIFFGVMGASVGGYLFFWTVIGEGSFFSRYATAALGSIAIVGFARQACAGYLPFGLVRGGR